MSDKGTGQFRGPFATPESQSTAVFLQEAECYGKWNLSKIFKVHHRSASSQTENGTRTPVKSHKSITGQTQRTVPAVLHTCEIVKVQRWDRPTSLLPSPVCTKCTTLQEGRCVRLLRTNLPVVRLSLNCSQCGGCSNKLRHPDRDLGRLRMIWRLHVAWGGYLYSRTGRVWSAVGKGLGVAVALPPRAPGTVGPRVSLPPEAGALKESSHVWAGFWLRGVQP